MIAKCMRAALPLTPLAQFMLVLPKATNMGNVLDQWQCKIDG
jgi:hypothetical protein